MGIVLLGGNGFLGRSIERALKRDHFVSIGTRSPANTGENFVHAEDYSAMRNSLEHLGPRVLINCATNYGRDGETDEAVREANLVYPQTVLKNLYDIEDLMFINIGTTLPSTTSVYAKTKNEFAAYLIKESFVRALNFKTEMFYGLELPPKNLVSRLITKGLKDEGEFAMSSGNQRRDFIHVDDVVGAVVTAVSNTKWWDHDEYILGTGRYETIRFLVDRLQKIIPEYKTKINWGALPDPVAQPEEITDVPRFQATGWLPKWTLISGLESVVEEYQKEFHLKSLKS